MFLGCRAGQDSNRVCLGERCFNVELAETVAERTQGLKYRKSLPEDRGMLFIFTESARYSFWMKDTLIPLDIIWLDYNKRIVHIEYNVPPCNNQPTCRSYAPDKNALYVLEINAGKAKELGMSEGMQLNFQLNNF